ncbi:hypothetical protein A2U01_0039552, partial [Trifolium medium]|nr:hypothetical protein [Trifolium medium]
MKFIRVPFPLSATLHLPSQILTASPFIPAPRR